MSREVECTHCRVLMTSWSAPGSPVRYWQCPFCNRTHSSLYAEVFERGAGARRIDVLPAAETRTGVPQATPQEIRWAELKARAARWFARLEEQQASPPPPRATATTPRAARAAANAAPRRGR